MLGEVSVPGYANANIRKVSYEFKYLKSTEGDEFVQPCVFLNIYLS